MSGQHIYEAVVTAWKERLGSTALTESQSRKEVTAEELFSKVRLHLLSLKSFRYCCIPCQGLWLSALTQVRAISGLLSRNLAEAQPGRQILVALCLQAGTEYTACVLACLRAGYAAAVAVL